MKGEVDFIRKPMLDILKDAIAATNSLGSGIGTYPASEYLMQSVFLKMTGALEQKLKSIDWILADRDYGYRFEWFNSDRHKGEMSSYKDKNNLYNALTKTIGNAMSIGNVVCLGPSCRGKLRDNTLSDMQIVFGSNLYYMNMKQWQSFTEKADELIDVNGFAKDNKNLFNKTGHLYDEYTERLYRHRNRCAHNVLSRTQAVYDLKDFREHGLPCDYFLWFAILILLDKVFVTLFDKLTSLLQ